MSETTGTWLTEWFAGQLAVDAAHRLEAEMADPGVPVWYGTCLGQPTMHPWSAVAGAMTKLARVFNLDKLHRRVLQLMGQEPL